MPVRFRCTTCRSSLSIARRKVGTDVKCPTCHTMVTVPTGAAVAAELTELLTVAPVQAPPKRVRTKKPKPTPALATAPQNLESLPLFERDDFERMLEPAVREAKVEPKAEPVKPDPDPVVPAVPLDGILILRSTATMLVAAVVVLLGLAFAAGFLVGSR